MKIYVIALALLAFSLTVTIFNTLGIFQYAMYEPGIAINQSDIAGVSQIDQDIGARPKEGILDMIEGGFEFFFKIWAVVIGTLGIALNLGGLFSEYVPGVVGTTVGTAITALTYFIYGWGLVQLWRRTPTTGMD